MDGVSGGLRQICLSAAGGARSAASPGRPKSRTAVARSRSLYPDRRGHSFENGLGRLRGAHSQATAGADGREQDERKTSLLYNVIFQRALGNRHRTDIRDRTCRGCSLEGLSALVEHRLGAGARDARKGHLARLRRREPWRSAWACVLELSLQCAWLPHRARPGRPWNRFRRGQMPDRGLFSWRDGNRSVFRVLVQPRLCACRV